MKGYSKGKKGSASVAKMCKYNGTHKTPAVPKAGHRKTVSKAKLVGHHRSS